MRTPRVSRVAHLLTAAALGGIVALRPAPARSFAVIRDNRGPVESALSEAARWNAEDFDGTGLYDGIQVAVHPSFASDLGAVEPEEFALVEQAIVKAFAAWGNDALSFELDFDSPLAEIGAEVGAEIDLITLPGDHPFFAGTPFFGLADFDLTFVPGRLLTNGTRTDGYVITGADVYINIDNVLRVAEEFGLPIGLLAIALTRLLMHEIGHGLGFDHPNEARNFDTDFDPTNEVEVDPLDPFAGLMESRFFDTGAIMSNDPCGGEITVACSPLFFNSLQPDDRLGRDVLYPVPEPSRLMLQVASLVALLALRRLRGSRRFA